tara:strand:- start:387 stop:839 length:453 start_codon:yes stop_codon:yes gene_type:complete
MTESVAINPLLCHERNDFLMQNNHYKTGVYNVYIPRSLKHLVRYDSGFISFANDAVIELTEQCVNVQHVGNFQDNHFYNGYVDIIVESLEKVYIRPKAGQFNVTVNDITSLNGNIDKQAELEEVVVYIKPKQQEPLSLDSANVLSEVFYH